MNPTNRPLNQPTNPPSTIAQKKPLNNAIYQDNYDALYHEEMNYTPWIQDTTYLKYLPYGSFRYNRGANYVPSYEDSIYLSRIHGFTKYPQYKKKMELVNLHQCEGKESEQTCRKLPLDTCANTDCCVVLGGEICVSGDEQGPYDLDSFHKIRNRDYYYYKNKCYGNCG